MSEAIKPIMGCIAAAGPPVVCAPPLIHLQPRTGWLASALWRDHPRRQKRRWKCVSALFGLFGSPLFSTTDGCIVCVLYPYGLRRA